jgi:L-lactate dehydrogenase (cytochrome)/(S)-mandelate dehydrogenase
MPGVRHAVTVEDLRRLAVARWPWFVGDYVERGGGDGCGVRSNVEAFARLHFLPRGLVDVTPVSTETALFGRTYACPFGISAVGTSAIYRRHADLLLAEAAREANLPFILSGVSSSTIEQVVRVAPANTWSQLYGAKEPEQTDRLVRRYADAGVSVLVFTVDTPVRQFSEVAARSGISLVSGITLRTLPRTALDVVAHPAWAWEYVRGGSRPPLQSWQAYAPAGSDARGVVRFFSERWLGNQTWRDLDRVRRLWPGTLVVKGLVHPDDAQAALQAGADAVTVSNHGGNKLDRMRASIEDLPDVVAGVAERVGGDAPILFDGGIRRGSDIVMAAALGARLSFVGRAALYGVGAGGLEGALRAIDILRSGLACTMAMIGCKTVSDIGTGHVAART